MKGIFRKRSGDMNCVHDNYNRLLQYLRLLRLHRTRIGILTLGTGKDENLWLHVELRKIIICVIVIETYS